jgi:predicted CoA-substrate-specific enzyme activase
VFAGIDVGTESIKIVVMNERSPLFTKMEVTEESGLVASRRLMEEARKALSLNSANTMKVAATGIGKKTVSFADRQISEQICHARGAHWLFPSARTVLDIGASGSRAMKLSGEGKLLDFALNSKCASGTGAFLETMTKLLETSFEEMSTLAAGVVEGTKISNYCAVFAESEVISKIHAGESRASIAAGIYEAVVDRLMEGLRQLGIRPDLVVTGGVAKNSGILRALEKRIKLAVKIPGDPQSVGALGAALIAREMAKR